VLCVLCMYVCVIFSVCCVLGVCVFCVFWCFLCFLCCFVQHTPKIHWTTEVQQQYSINSIRVKSGLPKYKTHTQIIVCCLYFGSPMHYLGICVFVYVLYIFSI
jgi:hypothetical protein